MSSPLKSVSDGLKKINQSFSRDKKHKVFEGKLVYGLERHGIDYFIDVGANLGQTALGIRRWGYDGEIVSIDPVQECYDKLVSLSADDPKWEIMDRMAVGDEEGTVDMRVSKASDLSSIHAPTEAFSKAFPTVQSEHTERVPLRRIDQVFKDKLGGKTAFLKIDAQGVDFQVLKGADGVLDQLAGVMIEASLQPLYDGEASYFEILTFLHELGMQPHMLSERSFSRRIHTQLQIDAVFFRPEAAN